MLSLWGFTVLVGILAVQRLWELNLSRANENSMRELGGFECFPDHYRVMVMLHISWFVAMLSEAWYFRTVPPLWLVIAGVLGLASGQILRYLAIRTLAERWSTRIYVVPDAPLIQHGIYRFVRHPNYWGVILEIACVPLIHAAYGTSILWSLANLFLLRYRISLEEQALKNSTNNSFS
jgi:methyltransferase